MTIDLRDVKFIQNIINTNCTHLWNILDKILDTYGTCNLCPKMDPTGERLKYHQQRIILNNLENIYETSKLLFEKIDEKWGMEFTKKEEDNG